MIKITNKDGAAVYEEATDVMMEAIEDLAGWKLSAAPFEEVGIDRILLSCEGDAAVNPLHSGGDVHWLGYLEEGPLELILGDAEGNQTSSRIIQPGEYMTFAPDTYHGWVPQGVPAKLIFLKIN
ncbi:MAG: hypothetical protein PQJ58_01420 [Spirochaetales bacterium]|nr:hypothetical protein [Spirochaetales bacterium]